MEDKKVAIVIIDDLLQWQKLNIVSFLAGSLAIGFPETHGEDFVTADGVRFLPFIKNPTLIFRADSAEKIQRAFRRSRECELSIGIYTRALFSTRGIENILEIARHTIDELDLVGMIVYGDKKHVDKALDGLKYHE